jgi:radical SAM superfamily enzyme YgiQ (UPF0313 family)
MPHVALVSFSGARVREREMLELGMTLPGLHDRLVAVTSLPPLGLLTIAAMVAPDWTVSLHETEARGADLLDNVLSAHPSIVAISALTASSIEAYAFSRKIQDRAIPTIFGGLHATTCAEEASRHFTSVIVGDGEALWPEVIADASHGHLKSIYRANHPFDLGRAPVPRYDLLGTIRRPRFTLQTQRGCPFACEFCGASRLLGPFRIKPIELVERELEAIAAIDARPVIELADDNTFAAPHRALALSDLFRRYRVRWFTEVDWRIGEQFETLAALGESGCAQLLVGVESLVFRYPGMGKKAAELDRVMQAVEAIQNAGVAVMGCFIVGGDAETRDSIDRLARFIESSPFADIQLTVQTPFPGTALYRRLDSVGRVIAERDWSYYTLFDVTFRPDQMTVAELEDGFRQLVRRVFRPEETIRRKLIRRGILRGRNTESCDRDHDLSTPAGTA